jgi:hypothetical protein
MECPICQNKTHVELDTHSDGYADNLQECGNCGALWISRTGDPIIIHGSIQAPNVRFA